MNMMPKDVSFRGGLILLSVLFSLLASALLGLSSCATARPEWMDSYPKDSRYFIGIGSSNTGNRGEDMEIARAKAVAALASSISTTIQSEQTFTTRESSGDGSFESAEIIIRETVDQHLQSVEVYDSFYSEDEGYWFFLRLDKAVWARIEQEGKNRIIQRVFAVIEPVLSDPEVTAARKLTALGAGWDIVNQSPYAGLLETAIQGQHTTLIDFIENEIGVTLDNLIIQCGTDGTEISSGSPLPLEIAVFSKTGRTVGSLPFQLSGSHHGVPFVSTITTGQEGLYRGRVDGLSLPPGEYTFSVSLDMESLGIDTEAFKKMVIVPGEDFYFDVGSMKALLLVQIPGGVDIPGVHESARAFLTRHLPFDLVSEKGADADYTVEFTLVVRDLPENDFGLFISYCRAAVSIVRDGAVIGSIETPEFKEGGLDYSQARQRAAKALFGYLGEDNSLLRRLKEALEL